MERTVTRTRRCKSSLPRVNSSSQCSLRTRALSAGGSVPRLISAKELRSTIYLKDKRLYRSDFAYFTLLTDDDSLPGALVLGWTLLKSGTSHDKVVMVTSSVGKHSRSLLRKVFDRVIEVDVIRGKTERGRALYANRMTKCNLFQFIEYKKILYIDVSVYVEKNIDELFDIEAPAGISSFVNSAGQDKWHGYRLPQEHVTKALQLSRGIRGCLMLLTPSISMYHYCRSIKNRRYGDFNFIHPDEDFYSRLFLNSWTHIHEKFALIPWQVKRVSRDVYGICLKAFKPWDDNCCTESMDILEWRLKVMQMIVDFPIFIRIFRRKIWFTRLDVCMLKDERKTIGRFGCGSLARKERKE